MRLCYQLFSRKHPLITRFINKGKVHTHYCKTSLSYGLVIPGVNRTFGSVVKPVEDRKMDEKNEILQRFKLQRKYEGLEKNVWVEFIQLALENKPLNLGQGFPDFSAPKHVLNALAEIVVSDNIVINQYTRGFGHPRLVQALSSLYSPLINRKIDPMNEILVTAGAYQSLYYAILANVEPGDEVIIIEPFFDCYEPMVRMAQGTPVFVSLKPTKISGTISSADWKLDMDEFTSKFNSKTKVIIINTPHNPLGKVFTKEELMEIGSLAKRFNCLVIMDEVYEWMVFDNNKHIRMASFPGMFERTLTVGSAGKTFSVTGWKLGWVYGPDYLIRNLQILHQNCVYTLSTVLQEAVAQALEIELDRIGKPECYLQALARELQEKRDSMAAFLKAADLDPVIPEGGYFMFAKWNHLADRVKIEVKPEEEEEPRDYKLVKYLSRKWKIQMIPPSAFYCQNDKYLGEDYLRFCFIKKEETLKQAAEILLRWRQSLGNSVAQ